MGAAVKDGDRVGAPVGAAEKERQTRPKVPVPLIVVHADSSTQSPPARTWRLRHCAIRGATARRTCAREILRLQTSMAAQSREGPAFAVQVRNALCHCHRREASPAAAYRRAHRDSG